MNEGVLQGAFDVTAVLFLVLRLAAGVGGALVGWFLTGPVVRLLYRGAFHRPAPGWLLPWTRLAGAARHPMAADQPRPTCIRRSARRAPAVRCSRALPT